MSLRTIVLLLLAVLLPAGSLGVVGLVLVRQQQEVLRLRKQDRSLLLARVAGDSLEARLDRTFDRVAVYAPPDSTRRFPTGNGVLYLGRVVNDRWVAPYATEIRSTLSAPAFQRMMGQMRRAEATGRRPGDLVRDYASARRASNDSAQTAYFTLQQARILKAVSPTEAAPILRPLARLNPGLTDEFGVPLALYALEMLGDDSTRMVSDHWLNPTAQAYRLDIDPLADDEEYELARFARTVAVGMTGFVTDPGSRWVLGRSGNVILSLRISELTALLADLDGVASVVRRDSSDQFTLAPPFPELALRTASSLDTSASMTPWMVGLGLILLLSAVGGFFLLRDVRREKKLATLRAEFVSSVSHEVRTPLAAIRLYTESLLRYGPGEQASWTEDLTTIADETHRLTRMLDNVLRASRIERGTADYRLADDRVDAAVHRAVQAMMPSLEEAGCHVTVDAEALEAQIDRDALEQAVVNLLSNAAKYAPGSRVRVGCAATADEVRVTVEDDGPGVAPEDLHRIFEPFFRGGTSAETGTGLGLSVVQHVAQGHHGKALVASAPGGGSRFTLQFPRSS